MKHIENYILGLGIQKFLEISNKNGVYEFIFPPSIQEKLDKKSRETSKNEASQTDNLS